VSSVEGEAGARVGVLTYLAERCRELLARTGADRVTVRVDFPPLGLAVDTVAAEACGPGVNSLAGDSSIDQRSLETVRWLNDHREALVQDDFSRPPFPPPALLGTYGVRAQVLAPVQHGGALAGWVSVHSRRPRPWAEPEVRWACSTADAVATALGLA